MGGMRLLLKVLADARPADGACTVDIPMERLELKAPQ